MTINKRNADKLAATTYLFYAKKELADRRRAAKPGDCKGGDDCACPVCDAQATHDEVRRVWASIR